MRRLLKSIWLIDSNIPKKTQIEKFGRWNCHSQNRAGHASRDRGFEWKIKRWFCNCINTIVNSSETFFLSFFFVRLFPHFIIIECRLTQRVQREKNASANRVPPSHLVVVVVAFFYSLPVNSLERFHLEKGVSVRHTSAAVAAGGITVYGVRFGANIFYLFISQLTIHWSDLLFYVWCASIFDSLDTLRLFEFFKLKIDWEHFINVPNTRNKH